MDQAFYFSFFFCMLARGANDLKLALEKPLLAFGDEFSYFLNRISPWALHG